MTIKAYFIQWKIGSFQALQHWEQPAAVNKLSLVATDVDSY